MTVELWDRSDYLYVKEWYSRYGQVSPPPELFPAWTFKIMKDERPVLFSAIYRDSTTMVGVWDFMIKNPDAPANLLLRAGRLLLDFFREFLPEQGVHYLIAHIADPRFSKIAQKHDFKVCSSGVDILVSDLNG